MIEMSSILEKFSRRGPLTWLEVMEFKPRFLEKCFQVSEAVDDVLKELKQGDHGDPELLQHLNKALDDNIHASGLLFKVSYSSDV